MLVACRQSSLAFRALLIVLALMFCGGFRPCAAADVSVTIAISPELAFQVREWRRAHGLPQAPEEAAQHKAIGDSRPAVERALQLAGLSGLSPDAMQVSAVHERSYWHVTIARLDASEAPYEIDVADALAARRPHAS